MILPKRGDRVRVTEAHEHSLLSPGDEITLTSDAYECGGRQAFGDAPPDAVAFMFESSVDGECGSHAVKVEILERAGEDDWCVNCDKPMVKAEVITEDGAHFCSERCYAEYFPKPVHPEFARGMRRAVEIAERLPWQLSKGSYLVERLKEAVEKELSNG